MKTKIKILLISSLFISSCVSNPITVNNESNGLVKRVSEKYGSSLQMKININSFSKKSTQNGVPAFKLDDIKSFKVWLCTNSLAPESSKVEGSLFTFDRDLNRYENKVTFVNVPANATYFSVVSAYKETVESGLVTNLNKSILYEVDGNKNLSVSTNSITVTPDFKIEPPDSEFDVNLSLQDSKDSFIETQITPIDGNAGIFSETQI